MQETLIVVRFWWRRRLTINTVRLVSVLPDSLLFVHSWFKVGCWTLRRRNKKTPGSLRQSVKYRARMGEGSGGRARDRTTVRDGWELLRGLVMYVGR